MSKWDYIREALKSVYGVDMVKQQTPDRGYISYDGVPLAVVDVSTDYVYVSLRSSIFPNDAGLIVGAIAIKYPVKLGENFEITNGLITIKENDLSVMMKQKNFDSAEYESEIDKQKINPN